jgi:hypothetical protein
MECPHPNTPSPCVESASPPQPLPLGSKTRRGEMALPWVRGSSLAPSPIPSCVAWSKAVLGRRPRPLFSRPPPLPSEGEDVTVFGDR